MCYYSLIFSFFFLFFFPFFIWKRHVFYSYTSTYHLSGMKDTFGSTCHGAGRAMSRSKSRRELSDSDVLESLSKKGISIRVASPNLVMEEVCLSRVSR